MADSVQLTDLDVIARYSIAVRSATADRDELIETLRADLTWLERDRRSRPASVDPALDGPADSDPDVATTGHTAVAGDVEPEVEVASPLRRAPIRRMPAPKPRVPTARKTVTKKTPAKKTAAKKTPAKKTPAKKTPRRA
jgi:hypothetical protein